MTDAAQLPLPISPDQVVAKRDRFVLMVGWQDVPHLTPEMIAEEKRKHPPHEIEARSLGRPVLGAGAIYPVAESEFVIDPFPIPDWMPQVYGLDVGWNKTAAVWGAVDRDNDVVYLYGEYYRGMAEPAIHAQAIRARGEWIPGVVDPAARGRGVADGAQLLKIYTDLGLRLSIANNALESGLLEVYQRLSTGRLKVFKHLVCWLKEFRFYQRDDKGRIKSGLADHAMDSTRYLVMSGIAAATVRPSELWTLGKERGSFKSDYDPYARV
jgi:hypothetical protein